MVRMTTTTPTVVNTGAEHVVHPQQPGSTLTRCGCGVKLHPTGHVTVEGSRSAVASDGITYWHVTMRIDALAGLLKDLGACPCPDECAEYTLWQISPERDRYAAWLDEGKAER